MTLDDTTYSSYIIDGSLLTWDRKARCGYLRVTPGEWTSDRTIDLGDGIHVDTDDCGRILGIERIGGAVNDWTLIMVLRRCLRPSLPIDGDG